MTPPTTWSKAEFTKILNTFSARDCARGLDYANKGMVVEYAAMSTHLTGVCRGSYNAEYDCEVYADFDGPTLLEVEAICSCPVGDFCKHCAALLITLQREKPTADARTAAPVDTGEWKRLVAELQELTRAVPSNPVTPVGLMFVVSQVRGATRIDMRPVAPGKTKPWILNRITWDHVFGLKAPDEYSADALRALRGVAQAVSGSAYFRYSTPSEIPLGNADDLWPALAAAQEAGVTFVGRLPDRKNTCDVEITDEVAFQLRVERTPDGATIGLDLQYDGLPLDPASTVGLGSGDIVASVIDGTLLIGRLPTLTPTERHMLDTHRQVTVPESALPELAAVLPTLTSGRTIDVDDGTLEPQVISPPRLRLIITCDPAGADLGWYIDYDVNAERRTYPIHDDSTDGYLRNDAEEYALVEKARADMLATVGDSSSWRRSSVSTVGVLISSAIRAGDMNAVGTLQQISLALRSSEPTAVVADTMPEIILATPFRLSLAETAVLCAEVVPLISERGVVEVTIENHSMNFRRPETDPTLHFSGDDGTDWFDLDIAIDVDGHRVPIADVIRALDAGETHMVLPDGMYFPLDAPELERLRELLDEARAMGELDRGKASSGTYNVSLWEELLSLGVVDEQLARWRDRIARLAQAEPPHPVEPPAGLRADLRSYQRDGLNWLSFLWDNRLGGILADDMGLGKTMQTLALIGRVLDEQPDARFLVVAPTSVVGNWAAEARQFLPDAPVVTVTATHKRLGPLADVIGDARIVVTSYTLMRIDYEHFAEFDWAAAIFDEAQFIKNHNAQTHKSARQLPAEIKLAITGTPMENRVMELWALVSVVAPGLFSSPQRFKEHFASPIESGREPDRLTTLRRRIKPIMLRRTKNQVLEDLPEKQEQKIALLLDDKHRKIYDTYLARERQRMLGLLDDFESNQIQILRALTAMRQLSLHPGLVDPKHAEIKSAKIAYLAEQIPELLAEGHSALVFSSFTGFLKLVAARFDADGINYSYLDGSMSARKRTRQIEDFTTGKTGVFLISLKAGGFGLNLTAADYCFVTDPWWNPAAESQAVDRAHRIGQKRAVTVYRMAAANTIEDKVIALQDRKRELFNALVDEGATFSGKITADDVRGLLE